MYCIGLTGNIASGKSTVAGYFMKLGIDVISADHIAKMLTMKGQEAYEAIKTRLGKSYLSDTGDLDRAKIRTLIFSNPAEKTWLESLLHPLIRAKILENIPQSRGSYCLIEIPLLPKLQDYPYLNRILLVQAHKDQQIKRLMARDHSTQEEALAILQTQAPDDAHYEIADDILINQLTFEHLAEQVQALHGKYVQYAGSRLGN